MEDLSLLPGHENHKNQTYKTTENIFLLPHPKLRCMVFGFQFYNNLPCLIPRTNAFHRKEHF